MTTPCIAQGKRHPRFSMTLVVLLGIPVLFSACSSAGNHDPEVRRERLLLIYPPGQTTRTDVQEKWTPTTPEFSVARPAEGWAVVDDPRLLERIAASERRTGTPVHLTDCYVGLDGRSSFDLLGLCYCWFYYDAEDIVVDVEWQYHPD